MGSGSFGVAAVKAGRHFVGTDLCAEAIGISRMRCLAAGGSETRDPLALAAGELRGQLWLCLPSGSG